MASIHEWIRAARARARQMTNPNLCIAESKSDCRVEHIPSGEKIASFKTKAGAERFLSEISLLD